jgi:hypothetical protein
VISAVNLDRDPGFMGLVDPEKWLSEKEKKHNSCIKNV